MGLAPAAFVLLLAPPVVELVLGPEWREVGVFMQILMLAKYVELIMAPTSTAFSIVNRQEIGVALMIIGAIARFGAMVAFATSPRTALAALSVTSAIFSLVYVAATWGVLRRLAADEEPAPAAP